VGTGLSVIAFIHKVKDKKYRHCYKHMVAPQEICMLLFALVALFESIPACDRGSASWHWLLGDIRWDI